MASIAEGPPLLWAQKFYWMAHRMAAPGAGWRNNVRTIIALPEGTALDDLREALRRLVDAYEVLRTAYRLGPGGDIVQVLHPEFEIVPEICDVSDAADRATRIREFAVELAEREFAPDDSPPVRVGIVVARSEPRMVVFVLHHIAIDSFGVMAFQQSLTTVLADVRNGRPTSLPSIRQPSAESRFEASRAGQRQNARSAAYWTRVADEFPATTVPVSVDSPVGHRPMYATLTSSAAPILTDLAKRCRAPESVVVLALFTAALRRFTGNTRTAIAFSSANRFQPDLLTFVGCVAQTIPLVLDPPFDGTVEALVSYVKAGLAPAYRYGRFDFDAAHGALLRRQFDRGVNLETMVSYNYVDRSSERDHLSAWTPEQFRRDDADGTVTYSSPFPHLGDQLGLLPRRSGGRLTLTLWHNAELFPQPVVEHFLRGLDRLLAAAEADASVSELVERADLPSLRTDGRWLVRDGCRISLADIERLLCGHPSVRWCQVVAAEADSGLDAPPVAPLVAYVGVEPGQPAVDPFDLRRFATARLTRWPAAVVPDRFVVVAGGDEGAGDESQPVWRGRPVLAADSGHRAPGFDAATPPAAALEAALGLTNPGADWSGAASYVTAGGEIGRIDAFLAALEKSGYTGLSYRDVVELCPPGELAGRLRPVDAPPAHG
jgi:hypothetical protein